MQDKGEKINLALREIPSVEKVLEEDWIKEYIQRFSHPLIAELVKEAVAKIKEEIKTENKTFSRDNLFQQIQSLIEEKTSASLRTVVNATGVVLHTNLGRAPWGKEILEHAFEISGNYNNLEFDIIQGKRSQRGIFLEKLLCQISGAESSLAVNNNATAVFLILSTFAKGKEVIVSRGELVQIGGGFRIPEILAESGAILKEVGTTNQTFLSDYGKAINSNTAMLLKIHQSNFKMAGFVNEVSINELVSLGQKHKILVVEDLGSGALIPTENFSLAHEPQPKESISAGLDLVCFSGDKLLGGPQAGIVLGKKKYVEILRKHPLYRVLRLDKIIISALEKSLVFYLNQEIEKIPFWKMIKTTTDELNWRAEKIKEALKEKGISIDIKPSQSTIGGGSLPGETLPTVVLCLKQKSAQVLAEKFRREDPPIIGRIEEDNFILDLRTVFPHQDDLLIKGIKNILLK
jgi:L-seryl-tRNA(Ser) seleniumtransferase